MAVELGGWLECVRFCMCPWRKSFCFHCSLAFPCTCPTGLQRRMFWGHYSWCKTPGAREPDVWGLDPRSLWWTSAIIISLPFVGTYLGGWVLTILSHQPSYSSLSLVVENLFFLSSDCSHRQLLRKSLYCGRAYEGRWAQGFPTPPSSTPAFPSSGHTYTLSRSG